MKIEITNQEKWFQSITLKLILLGAMGIVFLIPLEMIKSMIMERQNRAGEVRQEISTQWAGNQTISGPVLNIPVRTIPSGRDEKPVNETWHIMPGNLRIEGTIDPEIRYRGIYRSVIYSSVIKLSGDFRIPDETELTGYVIFPEKAYFTLGISDNRGLRGEVIMKAGDKEIPAVPGVRDQDLFISGISFPFNAAGAGNPDFSINMNLSGSEGLSFTPAGKVTKAYVKSSWTSPSFMGSFLPSGREVTGEGFTAGWEITHLNRNFPQMWTGKIHNTSESSFGVDLFQPVDHYQKSWRSARYGILFIALTFIVLIFLEITRRESLHVFHYFLVSLGLVLFFSLLNSLSEHIGFNMAYMVSSAATIALLTIFTGSLFRDRKTSLFIFGTLAVLYSFIYVLLTLNDYAYLAGNIGLFILLAVTMSLASRMKIFRKEARQDE